MAFRIELTPEERDQVAKALVDALELKETIKLGVEAGILADGLEESNNIAIARAQALLNLSEQPE
jgi:dihydrodipicolinate synthase/N-acetylneuraminate lyase